MSASPTSPSTREELYARVRATSRSAVTVAEMKRLGFLPDNDASLNDADQLMRRENELSQALSALGR